MMTKVGKGNFPFLSAAHHTFSLFCIPATARSVGSEDTGLKMLLNLSASPIRGNVASLGRVADPIRVMDEQP